MANWRFHGTDGNPALVRDCLRIAIVAVENAPARNLLSALPIVNGSFAIATYAESALAVKLGCTLERLSGPLDLGFFAMWREANRHMRTASVHGKLRICNGRKELAFSGGVARLLHDMRLWEKGELPFEPVQLARLRELAAAGIDVTEFPGSAAVNNRFAGLTLIRQVVISLDRLREAEAVGALKIEWASA